MLMWAPRAFRDETFCALHFHKKCWSGPAPQVSEMQLSVCTYYIHDDLEFLFARCIETRNNIARYSLINTKYRQMAFLSPSDGAPISPNQQFFGTPSQTTVIGNRQWETTHEICWLAAK